MESKRAVGGWGPMFGTNSQIKPSFFWAPSLIIIMYKILIIIIVMNKFMTTIKTIYVPSMKYEDVEDQ